LRCEAPALLRSAFIGAWWLPISCSLRRNQCAVLAPSGIHHGVCKPPAHMQLLCLGCKPALQSADVAPEGALNQLVTQMSESIWATCISPPRQKHFAVSGELTVLCRLRMKITPMFNVCLLCLNGVDSNYTLSLGFQRLAAKAA